MFCEIGKMHGLGGGTATMGCEPVTKTGWSVQLTWNTRGEPQLHIYHQDQSGQNIQPQTYSPFIKDQWQRVDLQVKINSSPDSSDGETTLYIDGKKVIEKSGLRLSGDRGVAIDRFLFNTFFDGVATDWSPPNKTFISWDNFIVYQGLWVTGKHGTKCERSMKGIYNPENDYCCSNSCVSCGGPNCESLNGGKSQCCIPEPNDPSTDCACDSIPCKFSENKYCKPTQKPTPKPTPKPTLKPTPRPASCMSGNTRVKLNPDLQLIAARDLNVGDWIEGLDATMSVATCSVEAIGHFGTGLVYRNYTADHFVLNADESFVAPNGAIGETEIVDKYAILTSCPVGIDESGIGFTAVDSDFLGHEAVTWSDYILIHQAILDIVRQVGLFVFWPSTYTSMSTVALYTKRLYKTMLRCAKNPKTCGAFEKAAMDLAQNSLTREARKKIDAGFINFGNPKMPGSISAVVSKGLSVTDVSEDAMTIGEDKGDGEPFNAINSESKEDMMGSDQDNLPFQG